MAGAGRWVRMSAGIPSGPWGVQAGTTRLTRATIGTSSPIFLPREGHWAMAAGLLSWEHGTPQEEGKRPGR